jgi:hypothetical protein
MLVLLVALPACGTDDQGSNKNLGDVLPFAVQVVSAIESGESSRIRDMLQTQSRPCSSDPSESPQCKETDPDGTSYDVFPSAVCQGFWTSDPDGLIQSVIREAGRPYALASLGTPPPWANEVPYGQYILIFEPLDAADLIGAVALYLTESSIVRAQIGCRRSDQFLAPGVDEETPEILWRQER